MLYCSLPSPQIFTPSHLLSIHYPISSRDIPKKLKIKNFKTKLTCCSSRLFVVTGCGVTLEEVCNGKFGAQGSQEGDKEFLEMVQNAAKEGGQNWILTEAPIATLVVRHVLWRGTRVSWGRHREWKNRKFAGLGQVLLPLGLSK
jgi:hypothetical protein